MGWPQRWLALGCSLLHATTAFLGADLDQLKILAMSSKFDRDKLTSTQQRELFKHAGFSDMELFMTQKIDSAEYTKSVKKHMKDQMLENMLANGGIDISQPLWRKYFFEDDPNKLLAEMVGLQEPMKSILRLIKSSDTKEVDYGRKLLKKYQYKSFNSDGSLFTENLDHILLETDGTKRKELISEIFKQEWFNSVDDPIQRSLLFYWDKSRTETDATKLANLKTQIRDLQYIQMFQGSLPENSPVSQDNLYTFYQLTQGQISPGEIMNVALGDEIGPLNSKDFEYYFGSSAKQFSCRAHTSEMYVPCGIELKPGECVKRGCCYDSTKSECYQDLYGKIGSSMARRLFIDKNTDFSNQIKGLFHGAVVPTLDKILREPETPYGVYMNKYNGGTKKYDKDTAINMVEYHDSTGHVNYNWWSQSTLKGPNYFENDPNGGEREAIILNQKELERPKYGRPGFEWKPHGPTQSPFFAELPGINPTANPLDNGLGTLDEYYKIWLEYASQQDQAQCALIPADSRRTCMRNFEALKDKTAGTGKCEAAGCCFSEGSFLKGEDACYRAETYGQCTNLPTDFKRKECGWDGITEMECLSNPKCCYNPGTERGVPWCHYKFSKTLENEEGWCEAWTEEKMQHRARPACFHTTKTNIFNDNDASNINNIVNQEQCERAGCCFDAALDVQEIEWLKDGLGIGTPYRCFKKTNPYIAQTINGATYGGQAWQDKKALGVNIALDSDTDTWQTKGGIVKPLADKKDPQVWTSRVKTCDETHWSSEYTFRRSCGENLSYYQCVYVNRCCYKPTVINEPPCYRPEWSS